MCNKFSALKRPNTRLANMPRGNEVGLTDGESSYVMHVFEQIEKLSDTGRSKPRKGWGKKRGIVNHKPP